MARIYRFTKCAFGIDHHEFILKQMMKLMPNSLASLLYISVFLYAIISISCTGDRKPTVVHGYSPSELAKMKLNHEKADNRRVLTIFPQIHTNLDSMVSQFVRVFYQDSENNFWFGTNGDGIIRYDGNKLDKFNVKEGFGGTAVRGIVEDKEGNVWFGTSGGLSKYDGSVFTNYSKKDGLIDNEIWDLMIDKNGLLWIGTVEGVSTYDGTKFTNFEVQLPKIENPQPMLSKKRVGKILEDRNGDLWFVNDGFGISIYNGKTFSFLTEKNGITDNNVADLLEDKTGVIWIGTYYGGLSSYDGKEFTNYTQDELLEGVEIGNLFENKRGDIWFSVENVGVYKYNGQIFTKYSTKDGLTTNGIQGIYEDKKEQIWFGSWSGISIYDGDTIANAVIRYPWTK